MKSKNFNRVAPKSELSGFHFFPLFFFFILFMYLLLLSSFCSSLSPAVPCPLPCPFSFPSMSCSPCAPFSLVYCRRIETKLRHTLSWSSICFSMLRWVKSSRTSCLFFFTLLITGIKKRMEKNIEHDAAINKYRKTCILLYLLLSLSLIMASVELLSASMTLFKLFCITKYTVEKLSTT